MSILSKTKLRRTRQFALGVVAGLLLAICPAGAQIIITNVQTANVTPAGFSVLASVSRTTLSSSSTAISVFADPGGVTNLAGQVEIEFYPLNSGDPTATNSYQSLLSLAALRQESQSLGLVYARVSLCAPGTTYYYSISVTNASGQSVRWPSSGPLPAVTTALENSFVLQSEQLVLTVSASFPPGSIITLSDTNTPSLLAAVVGDGAGNNQVFFNVNDLVAASGGTNFAPVGSQVVTASVFGQGAAGLNQAYNLFFTTNFSVGQSGIGNLGALATAISIGNGAILTGGTGTIPISVNSQSAVVGLSFVLNFPTNLFTAISVQPSIPGVSGASLSLLSSNTVRVSFATTLGTSFQGNQQIAQLNLTAASNQPSAFVPIVPQSPAGTNADSSVVADFSLQPGREVVIGAQSLLELQRFGGNLNLVLYGIPGDTYRILSSTNLARTWTNFALIPMTSLSQVVASLTPASAAFYRAFSFNADPPILQTVAGGAQRSLLAYGIPGTNYTLLSASNLPGVWLPATTYTLTNSFQYLTNLGSSSPTFYRLKR